MRSFVVTSVTLLSALVPAFVTALPGNSALGGRSLPGATHKHAAHAQAVRSPRVRRSTRSGKRCVARAPGNATVTDNLTTGGDGTIKNAKECQGIAVGATSKITASTGPNGAQKWLNCGLDGSGWAPPHLAFEDLVYVSLDSVAHKAPFDQCSADIIGAIDKYANQNQIPPIFLASFAMQESTCNPKVMGGGGEVGLFQLSPDKCNGRSTSECQDVDFNTSTAAKYFADQIKEAGGNVLLAMGKYNGWKKGLTYTDATAAATSSCCLCQNNLDYPHQFFNGWLQGVDPRTSAPKLGSYFNLEVCHENQA